MTAVTSVANQFCKKLLENYAVVGVAARAVGTVAWRSQAPGWVQEGRRSAFPRSKNFHFSMSKWCKSVHFRLAFGLSLGVFMVQC